MRIPYLCDTDLVKQMLSSPKEGSLTSSADIFINLPHDQSTGEPETSQLTDVYSISTVISITLIQKL